jgi:hypothetical protein
VKVWSTQALAQFGVVLYVPYIDTRVTVQLKSEYAPNLADLLANAYATVVHSASGACTSPSDVVLTALDVLRRLTYLSTWQSKTLVSHAVRAVCGRGGALRLVLNLNLATDYDPLLEGLRVQPLSHVRLTAPGLALLNLARLVRSGLGDAELARYARYAVELPRGLLELVANHLRRVGELQLTDLVGLAEGSVDRNLLSDRVAGTVLANDAIHLLLMYYRENVDRDALLRGVLRWVGKP